MNQPSHNGSTAGEYDLGLSPRAIADCEEMVFDSYVVQPGPGHKPFAIGTGVVMNSGRHPQRVETRTPLKVLVELSSFENIVYELTYTVNVSRRGARILSKDPWKPQQRLTVRSIEGTLNSRARVAYCVPAESGTFAIGLELDRPSHGWGPPSQEPL